MNPNTGLLHNSFVRIQEMTPDESANLSINYDFSRSPFGDVLVASTSKGICYLAFVDDRVGALKNLQDRFPNVCLQQQANPLHERALSVFSCEKGKPEDITLHLKGTPFQLKVWDMLLQIPLGSLTTYGKMATRISNVQASRAIGTAVGDNPVAYLVPCHRVVRSSGEMGGYRWGLPRKTTIIRWETRQPADLFASV